ncbi:putative aryl-alcohol protein [Xylariales sp. PMI_506]|nr:putative aryl-alcohol protein [Xylariales sp. PMI_506]
MDLPTDAPQALLDSIAATKVDYRRLGKSGLQVSVPILGCMSMGDPRWFPWCKDEEASLPILKHAFDVGINTWDTANAYSNGMSEEIIGKAIKKYNIPREKLVLMTKCYMGVSDMDPAFRYYLQREHAHASKDLTNNYGLSRAAIFRQVEASLRRLGTDYIDLYQIHRFDPNVPIEETMEALHDLVRMGKVRYIGASSMYLAQFALMQACADKRGWTQFVSMQNHYSLLYREEEREMNRYCALTGIGLIPYSPLARGILGRPLSAHGTTPRSEREADVPAEDAAIVRRVEEVARRRGWSMADVATAWIVAKVASPILGASSIQRVDDMLTARGKILTDEESVYLEELYMPKREPIGFS